MPEIDVVIPTFNRAWAVTRVAKAYLQQSGARRVIVVDDGSRDDTHDLLTALAEQDSRVTIIRHETNRGASAARNAGMEATESSYVFFADDDMVLDQPDGLVRMVAALEAEGADIVAPAHIVPEGADTAVRTLSSGERDRTSADRDRPIFNRRTLELAPREELSRRNLPPTFSTPLACGLMLVKRDILSSVRYDPALGTTSYRDETDFQLSALAHGFRLIAHSEILAVDLARGPDSGGCHSTSRTVYEWLACRNNWRILKRHRRVIRKELGISTPITLLQAFFVAEHAKRLMRHYLTRIARRLGLRRRRRS